MTVFFSRKVDRPLLVGLLLLLSLGAGGCGSAKGDLSGKISYNGKPVAVGSVLLIGADAKPRTTWIQEDGSYHFDDIPVGEAKLVVYSPDPAEEAELLKADQLQREAILSKLSSKMPPPPKPAEPELPAVDRTKWFAIPAEYSDVERSRLRITINPGPNTYHLEMK